ncbi:NUDIX domain-containing protein [Geoglobus acetivorans]|uniref:NUDIX domain-containing protein n=1 Tax=Geoglobus acetivorans TaxID=565033 RepID=A0ABZ3H312_GEOAI|nr:NUDIX domain-containing protein [Geoglobus acetivorans]
MRRYPERPLVGVGAVVIRDGKILLVKRANEPNKGKWSVPGGLVRKGERLEEALEREIWEELGVGVVIKDVACVTDEIILDEKGNVEYHYVIVDFFAEITGEPRAMSDAEEVAWIGLDDIESVDVVDFVKKLVAKIEGAVTGTYLR